MQSAGVLLYCRVWPAVSAIFFNISHKRHDFRGEVGGECVYVCVCACVCVCVDMYVYIKIKRLSETFLIRRRIQRDIVLNFFR